MRATTIAIIVALGLALTGVALGLLYMDTREWQATVLRERLNGHPIVDSDDLPGGHNMPRRVGALVCGSVGVGLTGFGAVLLLCRTRFFAGEGFSHPIGSESRE